MTKTRLGRPVRDAKQSLVMPLTKRDIATAAKKRHDYDVNDPDNFSECVLATCLAKVADVEVLIMRRHAYVALPDEPYTLRYELPAASKKLVELNDEQRFDEIPANVNMELRAPSPRRRLEVQRRNAKAHDYYRSTRGSGRRQRNVPGHQVTVRNGVHA